MSSQVLAHFDLDVESRLACDTSDYGIGAVSSHMYPDGMEKPVVFMSHTLNEAATVFALIYGTAKKICISDHSVLIRMC